MRNRADDNPAPGDAGLPSEASPPSADQLSTDNPDEIRGEIIQTRAEMSETLNAIQQRLDPDRLKAQARGEVEQLKDRVKDEVRQEFDRVKGEIRDATIGKAEHFMHEVDYQAREAGNGFLDRVRANPIPAALVGFGLAWLFMSGPRAPRRYAGARHPAGSRGYPRRVSGEGYGYPGRPSDLDYYDSYDYGRGYYGEGPRPGRGYDRAAPSNAGQAVRDTVSGVAGQVQDQVSQVKDQLGDLGDQVQGQVQQVGQQMQQLGNQIQDQVSNVGDQMQDRFQDVSGDFQDEFSHLRWQAERAMRENPLAMGVLAMAAGAAVGMLVPETPQEDQLLGGPREQLMQRAGAAAQDALEKVQDRVQQAAERADQAVDSVTSDTGASSSAQPARANPPAQPGAANEPRSTPGGQGGQSRVA